MKVRSVSWRGIVAAWATVVAVGLIPTPGVDAAEGQTGMNKILDYGGCKGVIVTISVPNPNGGANIEVPRGGCQDNWCSGICVKHTWGTELQDYDCYCDIPFMHGTEPGAER